MKYLLISLSLFFIVGCTTTDKTFYESISSNDLVGSWATKKWRRDESLARKVTFFEDFKYEMIRFRNDEEHSREEGTWELDENKIFLIEKGATKDPDSHFFIEYFDGSSFDLTLRMKPRVVRKMVDGQFVREVKTRRYGEINSISKEQRPKSRNYSELVWPYLRVPLNFTFEE